jgi:hypothetical protein
MANTQLHCNRHIQISANVFKITYVQSNNRPLATCLKFSLVTPLEQIQLQVEACKE